MRTKIALLFGLGIVLAAAVPPAPAAEVAARGPAGHAAALAPLLPAVVRVQADKPPRDPLADAPLAEPLRELLRSGRGEREPAAPKPEYGSGFVYDAAAGLVATAEYVVTDATALWLEFADGRRIAATLVAADAESQLALLRVDPAATAAITAPAWGDSTALRVGEPLLVAGYPYRHGLMATAGIYAGALIGTLDGEREYLATDAAIMRGSAGGPVVDAAGRVVGVAMALLASPGDDPMGMAVPGEVARTVLERLRSGPVRRGAIGVQLDADATLLVPGGAGRGLAVAGVAADGPAQRAGLAAGDRILEINGRPALSIPWARRVIGLTPPGQSVTLTLERAGVRRSVAVTVEL